RRIRAGAFVATAVALGLVACHSIIWFHDASYLDQLSNPIPIARQNVPAYLRALSDVWDNGHSGTLRKLAFVAGSGFAAVGFVTSLQKGATIFPLFTLVYLAAVMVWPSYQGIRFLLPVVPFYFCCCLLGVRRIDAAAERRWAARHVAVAAFLAALLGSYAARYSTLEFGTLSEGIAKKESRELFAFVTTSTD